MVKIIDIDALFDKYISDYVYTSIGKEKPEEIENKIPALYISFGDTKLKDLDGKTIAVPNKGAVPDWTIQLALKKHGHEINILG